MFSSATLICLALLLMLSVGLYLWWLSVCDPLPTNDCPIVPHVYTHENVRVGGVYHAGWVSDAQSFEVLYIHWSGFFLIRCSRLNSHTTNHDYPPIEGWVRTLSSSQPIESHQLLAFLPLE